MKAIVLAGGYAKRMWPLTIDTPKQLLPIAGKPMIEYVVEELELIDDIDTIFISTNKKFGPQFIDFFGRRQNKKKVDVFIEPSEREEDKLGSVGALKLLIDAMSIDEEALIIGGDNLFEFNMVDLIKHLEHKGSNILVLDSVDTIEEAKLFGVAEVGEDHKILSFEEKPENPKSKLVSTACYILTKKGIEEIKKYLEQGGEPDKLGHFIQWLCQNDEVYAFTFEGKWFDIGSTESYHEADAYFKQKLNVVN